MCVSPHLTAANLAIGGLAGLTGWANRDKLKSGFKKLGSGVNKVTDKVTGWADNTLKIN